MSGQLEIDGALDGPEWKAPNPGSGFTQTYPQAGEPSTQLTEVRVLYDDAHLYVGVRLHDTAPDPIAAPLSQRGTYVAASDWVHVLIDSRYDRWTAEVRIPFSQLRFGGDAGVPVRS